MVCKFAMALVSNHSTISMSNSGYYKVLKTEEKIS